MKSVYLTFMLFLFPVSSLLAQVPDVNKEEINDFINELIAAVTSGDREAVMSMMDPAYRMEQHDKFHQGNTKRFLDELFCGNVPHTDDFRCIRFKKVRHIELGSMGEGSKTIPLSLRVSDKKGSVDVYLTLKIREENGMRKYGIVGAVG